MSDFFFDPRLNVKARKEHRCDECSKPIPKGTLHYVQAATMDGTVYTYRAHGDCRDAVEELWRNAGLGYDEFPNLREHYEGEPHEVGKFLLEDFPDVAERLGVEAMP